MNKCLEIILAICNVIHIKYQFFVSLKCTNYQGTKMEYNYSCMLTSYTMPIIDNVLALSSFTQKLASYSTAFKNKES